MLRVEGVPIADQTLTFDASPGRCLGILYADRTRLETTAETLAGLRPPSAGRVTIDDLDTIRDAVRVRARVTIALPRVAAHTTSLTEHLSVVAAVRGPVRLTVAAACARLGVPGDLRLSTPRARAVAALIAALLPEKVGLVVLHEPFLDFDDATRTKAIDWIRALDSTSTAVVITSTRERDVRAVSHTVLELGGGK